jgi:hypothetical protein
MAIETFNRSSLPLIRKSSDFCAASLWAGKLVPDNMPLSLDEEPENSDDDYDGCRKDQVVSHIRFSSWVANSLCRNPVPGRIEIPS